MPSRRTRTRLFKAGLLAAFAGVGLAGWWAASRHGDAQLPGNVQSTLAPLAPSRPRRICNDRSAKSGPSSPPSGAVVVASGNDDGTRLDAPHTTYWFAPGTHTLGTGQYSQIHAGTYDTYIGAPGAVLSGQRLNYYAFTMPATHVTIEYLTIDHFVSPAQQGVVNHTGGASWTIEHDTVRTNPTGAAVMLGSHDLVSYDCLTHNGQYGFNSFANITSPTLSHDEISYNDGSGSGGGRYDQGPSTISCGCSGGGKFWMTRDGVVTTNWVYDNGGAGIWVDTDNSGFLISHNYISHNYGEGIVYEISYNAKISDNTLVDNAWKAGLSTRGFPAGAIYISGSGGSARVTSKYKGQLEVTGNVLRTNWSGVVLWQDPNRYCGDGSDPVCTLVTPATYSITSCKAHLSRWKPPRAPDYYGNCVWKTKTVTVAHNLFSFARSKIPNCTQATWCGFNALFSEYGSSAPWKGWIVAVDVSDRQDNRFRTNVYVGPWHFDGLAQGDQVTWTKWTKGFTGWKGSHDRFRRQDAGSTIRP